ncbi:glutamate--tRNA ligase [Balneolaceae bacterium ANBcel3]|nr:glutamate--tRNA ligase [Balneolaceae bacterium ANBcel3]
MSSRIRVRFAPSPTGLLHIGGLRTALYNYLFAKKEGGTFVLRIEDTDQKRYVKDAEDDILQSLTWAGIVPDEGPGNPGEYGPYRQSERKERYLKYAEQLVDAGYAYYAFDTPEEIEHMKEHLRTPENPTPKYEIQSRMTMRNSLTLSDEEISRLLSEKKEYVIRLKIPDGERIHFEDAVRGPVSFESEMLDDQVLIKADGMPTYHLANVVDDHEMKISHVIRGEEWLSSAPKHILLYTYFGWDAPEMAHLPLIMSPSGGKLSKRKAEKEGIPINTKDYREQFYEPEALVNFLALLGWSPGDDRELLSMKEMVESFSLDRIGKSGAIFDHAKLLWFNEHYIRAKSDAELAKELQAYVKEVGIPHKQDDNDGLGDGSAEPDAGEGNISWPSLTEEQKKIFTDTKYMETVVRLLKERVSRLPDFLDSGSFFFEAPAEYDAKAVKKGWKEATPSLLQAYTSQLDIVEEEEFKAPLLKTRLKEVIEKENVGMGKLMMPVRIAVTGLGSGPDLFESMELLGKEEVLRRIHTAIEKLSGS